MEGFIYESPLIFRYALRKFFQNFLCDRKGIELFHRCPDNELHGIKGRRIQPHSVIDILTAFTADQTTFLYTEHTGTFPVPASDTLKPAVLPH